MSPHVPIIHNLGSQSSLISSQPPSWRILKWVPALTSGRGETLHVGCLCQRVHSRSQISFIVGQGCVLELTKFEHVLRLWLAVRDRSSGGSLPVGDGHRRSGVSVHRSPTRQQTSHCKKSTEGHGPGSLRRGVNDTQSLRFKTNVEPRDGLCVPCSAQRSPGTDGR